MKVGDLVMFTPDGIVNEDWDNWYGIVMREIPGTDERKVVMWSCGRGNNVKTANKKKDLTVVNESR
jgi:hypothetical protein